MEQIEEQPPSNSESQQPLAQINEEAGPTTAPTEAERVQQGDPQDGQGEQGQLEPFQVVFSRCEFASFSLKEIIENIW